MTCEFRLKLITDPFQHSLERTRLAVLQRQHDHGIPSLVLVEILPLTDTLLIEKRTENIPFRLLEEITQHRQVQRLSETARTGKQRDLAAFLYHLTDKIRLIHIVEVVFNKLLIVTDTDRYSLSSHNFSFSY